MTRDDSLKARLLGQSGPRFQEKTITLEGVGDITFRALSRDEVLTGRERNKNKTTAEIERVLVALAMIEPQLTEDEVAEWQAASPAGELETITREIMHLSGMNSTSGQPLDKEAYKSV